MLSQKPKVAFFDYTCCEGCQLTVIDSLQTHPGLLDAIEIVQFREAMSEKRDDYQIAFIEGACTRPEDEIRLRAIRAQAEVIVALGACAHIGGVNSLRNWQSIDKVKRYVYGAFGKQDKSYSAKPIDAIITVDAFVPGCPIDREEFIRTIKAFLLGRKPSIPDYPVCFECKLRENACVLLGGEICLGPIVRAGCGALCPSLGVGCYGCRGLVSNPNLKWFEEILADQGFNEKEISNKKRLFLSYQLLESETHGNGSR